MLRVVQAAKSEIEAVDKKKTGGHRDVAGRWICSSLLVGRLHRVPLPRTTQPAAVHLRARGPGALAARTGTRCERRMRPQGLQASCCSGRRGDITGLSAICWSIRSNPIGTVVVSKRTAAREGPGLVARSIELIQVAAGEMHGRHSADCRRYALFSPQLLSTMCC